ncbi:MAG: AAA family ATPase [Chloroflexi bacterium]|nr:AAA family ATPase [Chloroflexota bacterium]
MALRPHLHKPVGDLSGGLKQRLALALALLADPPILLLDEPTASLDTAARTDFLALLQELKHQGKTIIFSTHRYEEIIALADRVLHMADGKLVADCHPTALVQ